MFGLQPTRQNYELLPHDPTAFEDEELQHRSFLGSATLRNSESLGSQVHHVASLT